MTEEQQKRRADHAVSAIESIEKIQAILATIREAQTHMSFAMPANEKILEIDSIELAKEGGILVYYKNCEHTRKGFAHNPSVTAVDNVKKVLMGLLHGFSGFRGKMYLVIFYLLFSKRIATSFQSLLDQLHFMVLFHRLKPQWYCRSAREVYRAIDHVQIRDLIVLILEFDDSYRFRFQDAVGELDKTAFSRNPIKEIDRLLSLLQTREKDERLKGNWKMARKILFFGFFFKKIRVPIITAFSKLRPEEIRMDDADRYFASLKQDGYAWGGLTLNKKT